MAHPKRTRIVLLAALCLLPPLGACGEAPAPGTSPAGAERRTEGVVPLVTEGGDPARPGYHDFGEVPVGDFVGHTFLLENRDPVPVVLTSVTPGCGCTVARLSKRTPAGLEPSRSDLPGFLLELQPGEVAELAVRVDSSLVRTKNMDKLFMVRVATDAPYSPSVTLECHLVVVAPFQVFPEALALDRVPLGGGARGEVTVRALTPLDRLLSGTVSAPPGVRAELRREDLGGAVVWKLEVALEPPLEPGPFGAVVRLGTMDAERKPLRDLELPVTATVVPDVGFEPGRLILRPALGPGGATVTLRTHLAGHRFTVLAATLEGEAAEDLQLAFTPDDPDDLGRSPTWTLRLTAGEGLDLAQFAGTARITTDDPVHTDLTIDYVGLGFAH